VSDLQQAPGIGDGDAVLRGETGRVAIVSNKKAKKDDVA
jgi:hypothetical protein